MKRLGRALAVWSALGYFWAVAPLLADPPGGDVDTEVEQFHGLKRVGAFSMAVQARVKPTAAIEPEKVTFVSGATSGEVWKIVSAHEVRTVAFYEPGVAKDGPGAMRAAFVRPRHSKADPAAVPSVAAKFESQLPAKPAQENRSKSSQAEPSYVVVKAARENSTLTAVTGLAGTILTPLAGLAGIWIVVGYLQGRSGPLLRIEHVGRASSGPADTSPKSSVIELPPTPIDETSPAETFELGPTFEAERLAREQHALQEKEGVLRKLFDDNVKLQKQLKQTHDEWSSHTDAEPESASPADSPPMLR